MLIEKHFHFIVPVWGEKYTKLFTDTCLPMLMTPRNLHGDTYGNDQFIIVTTLEDSLAIKASPAFTRLQKIIVVKFILFDNLVKLHNVHVAMSYCYSLAMNQKSVVPGKTHFILLTPDSFWSEGTFERLRELMRQNFKVAMAIGIRVNAEGMSEDLKNWGAIAQDSVALSKEELVGLVITNLHQMSKALNWFSKATILNVWPSHIYWINEKENQIIAHCFHMHPIMVQASPKTISIGTTIDGAFVQNLKYPLTGYYIMQDDFFGVELSLAERSWTQTAGSPSLSSVYFFSMLHANRMHRYFFKHRIILTAGTPISPELEIFVDHIVDRLYSMHNNVFYRVYNVFYRVYFGFKIFQRGIGAVLKRVAKL